MTCRRGGKIAAGLVPAVIWLGSVLAGSTLWADGGAVVLSGREGDYQVTVLASPAVLHVGPADLSVLVQDAVMGEPVDGLSVMLCLTPAGSPSADGLRLEATHAAATNKLFYAARCDLPTAGRWTLAATVAGPGQAESPDAAAATLQGPLEVVGPPPQWLELWPWIGWPAVVVLLFALRERLVCNHRENRGRGRRLAAGRPG